jgi:hypothetical protein
VTLHLRLGVRDSLLDYELGAVTILRRAMPIFATPRLDADESYPGVGPTDRHHNL